MKVYDSKNDTTYYLLLGEMGYIYKPNWANGRRRCYKKAAQLGSLLGEIKSHSSFRSRTIATGSSSIPPGDSLNMLGFNSNSWNLGYCYENGLGGGTIELNIAKEWHERAKAAGKYGAKEALKRLAKRYLNIIYVV